MTIKLYGEHGPLFNQEQRNPFEIRNSFAAFYEDTIDDDDVIEMGDWRHRRRQRA